MHLIWFPKYFLALVSHVCTSKVPEAAFLATKANHAPQQNEHYGLHEHVNQQGSIEQIEDQIVRQHAEENFTEQYDQYGLYLEENNIL